MQHCAVYRGPDCAPLTSPLGRYVLSVSVFISAFDLTPPAMSKCLSLAVAVS